MHNDLEGINQKTIVLDDEAVSPNKLAKANAKKKIKQEKHDDQNEGKV